MKISNWTTNIANQTNNDLDWPGFTGFVAKRNQSRITRFWGKSLNSNFYLCKIYDISQLCILTFHIHCCTFTIALLLSAIAFLLLHTSTPASYYPSHKLYTPCGAYFEATSRHTILLDQHMIPNVRDFYWVCRDSNCSEGLWLYL